MTNCPTELTRKRRKAVLKVLGDRMAVVFAGEGGAGLHGARGDQTLTLNTSRAFAMNLGASFFSIRATPKRPGAACSF